MFTIIIFFIFINSVLSQICDTNVNTTLSIIYGTVSVASFDILCCNYTSVDTCNAVIDPFSCLSNQYLSFCIRGYDGIYCSSFVNNTLCTGVNTIEQNCTGLAQQYSSSSIGYDYLCCDDGIDCVKSNTYCGVGVGAAFCINDGYNSITCSGVSPSKYSYNVSRCITNNITTNTSNVATEIPTATATNIVTSDVKNNSNLGVDIGVPIGICVIIGIGIFYILRYRNKNVEERIKNPNIQLLRIDQKPDVID